MSDSPEAFGDAQEVLDVKRPAEDDGGSDAIPRKFVKIAEKAEDEDAAVLEEDEQELDEDDEEVPEEGDDLDFCDEDEEEVEEGDFEEPAEENMFDETGESSDMDEFVQANLAYMDDCQSEIDALNDKANDEILKVEQKYNKLKQPVYSRRNTCIDKIPNFWATVFSRHPQLKRVLTKEDLRCLKFLTSLQIDDFEDSRSGYAITFKFSENTWFTNSLITKEYHLPWRGYPSCSCTRIDWKPGMNLTSKSSSFFSWFCSQEDSSSDDIAEIIKEELWPNPLQCYLLKENGEAETTDESDGDDGPVYVDDEEAEYISSDDGSDREEWKRPATLGKEAPSTSKEDDFCVIDDDENDDGAEDDDDFDDDDVVHVSSDGNYSAKAADILLNNEEARGDYEDIVGDEDDDVIAGDFDATDDKILSNDISDNSEGAPTSSHPVSATKDKITSQQADSVENDIKHGDPLSKSGETET